MDGKPVRRFLGMNDSVSWDVVRSEGDKIAVPGIKNSNQAICLQMAAAIRTGLKFQDNGGGGRQGVSPSN